MEIPFTKMHGTGNDFVLIDCRDIEIPDPTGIAMKYCHRRFGIGADQLLLLYPSTIADFRMRILNPDGSEVEMCGNGIRCLAKYIWDRNISDKEILDIETLAGIIRPEKSGSMVRVDMGEPIFEPEKIPVNIEGTVPDLRAKRSGVVESGLSPYAGIIDYPLQIKDMSFKITCVSMGNPHAVIFMDRDITEFPIAAYGPQIETHKIFPKRTNVEFINVIDMDTLSMRVWERGAGETMACGTGASAAAVAAMLKGITNRKVDIQLKGGKLIIEWLANNRVYMTGPAVEVFEGRVRI